LLAYVLKRLPRATTADGYDGKSKWVEVSRKWVFFGSQTVVLGAGLSNAGRPRLPFRLMVSLLYLKHAYNESDEGLVDRWSETPTWQYFSGMDYFEHLAPCDPSLIGKFRKLIGEEGVEELLASGYAHAKQFRRMKKP
jgi:hypothetical protein